MSMQHYILHTSRDAQLYERISLPQQSESTVLITAQAGSHVCLLIESHASCNGSLTIELNLHEHATVLIAVCVRVSGSDNFQIKSTQFHMLPHGTSRVWVRKIVSDKATATYHGFVHVAPEAMGTVVSQDDKTLLDGLHARAESTPVLEVLTNDVSCAHGSALGSVDPLMVWYMQTRGITVHDARTMLYDAFFDDVCQMLLQKGL